MELMWPMIAPKGPDAVRSEFVRGAGVPCLVAVDRILLVQLK